MPKGDWTRADESAQQDEGSDGSWVHAYPYRPAMKVPNTTLRRYILSFNSSA
jgi:hypothetical protein